MNITVRDLAVINYLREFHVASTKQLIEQLGCSKKTIKRLVMMREVYRHEQNQEIVVINAKEISLSSANGIIDTMDILFKLKAVGGIEDIVRMDSPYIAAGQKNNEYFYFIYVPEEEVKLYAKIINHENRGNLVLIMKDKEQAVLLNKYGLEKNVSKIYFTNEMSK